MNMVYTVVCEHTEITWVNPLSLLTTYFLSPVLVMHNMLRLRFYKKLSDTTAETRDFAVIIRA